jgi:hypothetical protein
VKLKLATPAEHLDGVANDVANVEHGRARNLLQAVGNPSPIFIGKFGRHFAGTGDNDVEIVLPDHAAPVL